MNLIKMLMVSALTVVYVPLFAQDSNKQDSKNQKQNIVATKYSCPMKCEGNKTYDKPGKCPKCRMELKEQKKNHSNHNH